MHDNNEIRNLYVDFIKSDAFSERKLMRKLVREASSSTIYRFDCPDTRGMTIREFKNDATDLFEDGKLKLPSDSFMINQGRVKDSLGHAMNLSKWVRSISSAELEEPALRMVDKWPELGQTYPLHVYMLWHDGPVAVMWALATLTDFLQAGVRGEDQEIIVFTGGMYNKLPTGGWAHNPKGDDYMESFGNEAFLDLLLFVRAYQNEELAHSA